MATGAGTGKTLVLAVAIKEARERGEFRKAIVLEPLKVLAEQVAQELRKWFPTLKTTVISSDYADTVGLGEERNATVRESDIVVATNESIEYMTRDPRKYDAIYEATDIFVDEAHGMGESGRGGTLDTGLTRYLMTRRQGDVRVILASATIANPEDFKSWLASFGLNVEVVHSDFSPVLSHLDPRVYVYGNNDERVRVLTDLAVKAVREKRGPVIVLLLQRGLTEDIRKAVDGKLGPGSAFVHHAGLSKDRRAQVERMFREGLVKVLVSTPTTLAGFNAPAQTNVLDTTFFDTHAFRHGSLKAALIVQAMGRAGRVPFWKDGYVHLAARADTDWERKMASGLVARRPGPPPAPFGKPSPELLAWMEKMPSEHAAWVRRRAAGAEVPPEQVAEVLYNNYRVFEREFHPEKTCWKLAMLRARVEAPGAEAADEAPSPLHQLEQQLNSPCFVRGALLDSPAATILSQVVIQHGEATDASLMAFLKRTFAWHSYSKRRWGRSCRLGRIVFASSNVLRHHPIEGTPMFQLPLEKAHVRVDESEPPDEGFLRDLRWLAARGFVRTEGQEGGAIVRSTKKGDLAHRSGLDPRRVQEVLDAVDRPEATTPEQFLDLVATCYGFSQNRARSDSYLNIMRGAWLCSRSDMNPASVIDTNWGSHPSDIFGDDMASEAAHLDMVLRPLTEGSSVGANYDLVRMWATLHGAPLPLVHLAFKVLEAGGTPDHRQLLLAYLNGARANKPLPPPSRWTLPTQVQNLASIEQGGNPVIVASAHEPQRVQTIMRGWPA